MDKHSQRIRTMIRTIETYLHDYTEQSDTDKIHTLMECVGCLSAALESQQEIIKDIITDKDIKKIREEQQEQISIQAKDPWEEYLKGDFNGAIKIKQDTDHEKE